MSDIAEIVEFIFFKDAQVGALNYYAGSIKILSSDEFYALGNGHYEYFTVYVKAKPKVNLSSDLGRAYMLVKSTFPEAASMALEKINSALPLAMKRIGYSNHLSQDELKESEVASHLRGGIYIDKDIKTVKGS